MEFIANRANVEAAKSNELLGRLILPFFRSMGLDDYLLDPEVSELMITNGLVFVEKAGQGSSRSKASRSTSANCAPVSRSSASRSATRLTITRSPGSIPRLPDGSRVAATIRRSRRRA